MEISDELSAVERIEESTSSKSLMDENVDSRDANDDKINDENESDEETFTKQIGNKKKFTLVNSDDSEDEQNKDEPENENISLKLYNDKISEKSSILKENDESNSNDVQITKKNVQKKRIALIDSDSSEDESDHKNENLVEENGENKATDLETQKSPKNKFNLADSENSDVESGKKNDKEDNSGNESSPKANKKFSWLDSESSVDESTNMNVDDRKSEKLSKKSSILNENDECNSNDVQITKNVQKKRIALIDSDSSEDESDNKNENLVEKNGENKATDLETPKSPKNKFNLTDSENSDVESGKKNDKKDYSGNESSPKANKKFSWLDSESSADESTNVNVDDPKSEGVWYSSDDEKSRSLSAPKPVSKKSTKKIQEKRITGKEILEQRKEIQSESQRMLREKQVYLPYHKPKQRTLKEFLKNRPRFAEAIPIKLEKAPASIAIKMSNKHLDIISKNIEKREEEIKEFFKSESEESDVEQEIPEVNNKEIDNIIANNDSLNKIEEDLVVANDNTEIVDKSNTDKTEESVDNTIESAVNINIDENLVTDEENSAKNQSNFVENEDNTANTEICNQEKIDDTISLPSTDLNNDSSTNLTQNQNNEDLMETSDILDKSSNSNDKIITTDLTLNSTIDKDLPVENKIPVNEESPMISSKNESVEDLKKIEETIDVPNDNLLDQEVRNTSNNSVEFDIGDEDDDDDRPDIDTNFENDKTTKNEQNFNIIEEDKPKLSKLALLKQQLGNTVPKLSCGPKDMIILDDTIKDNEVTKLMERYMQHNCKKKPKSQTEISIVNVISTGEILKETVSLKLDKSADDQIIEKPGVKLKLLRSELENQMAQKRSELWLKKKTIPEQETSEIEICKKKVDNEYDDDKDYHPGDDCEDEFDEDDVDEGCGDDSGEDNEFAAIIEEDDDVVKESQEENEDENNDDEENSAEEEEDADVDDEDSENEDVKKIKIIKKKRKRIINDNNDDDSDDEVIVPANTKVKINNTLPTTESCDSDDYLEAGQKLSQTPIRQKIQSKSDLGFLTPVYHLTGLQDLNSGSKYSHDSPGSPAIKLSADTPGKSFQKALFSDEISRPGESFSQLDSEVFPTQSQVIQAPSTQEIEELCSGKFTGSSLTEITQAPPPSTQEIEELCSGKFTGISSVDDTNEENFTKDSAVILSNSTKISENLVDLEENDDNLITQILNDEEMREFKKKFESPIIGEGERQTAQDPSLASKIQFDSSSDEDEEDVMQVKKRKRNIIEDSDEESDKYSSDENIELHDEDQVEDEENYEVAYDSEENEVYEETPKPKEKLKIKDFLENEAELSESEWESEDEDERGLDKLEIELGDDEKFDENKVRRDLEKIHMRRILDDDQQEIKILQELLLEDGELHGTGRQRQFKWKNLDNDNFETNDVKTDVENLIYEELEDEQEWRKKRHERELFLKKHLENSQGTPDEIDVTVMKNSQVVKLGQKAIIKNFNSTICNVTKTVPKIKEPLSILNNKRGRGSFLTRPENELSRLANLANLNSTGSTTKNSRNFVFQSVKLANVDLGDKKRKEAPGGTPKAIKKLRISENTLT